MQSLSSGSDYGGLCLTQSSFTVVVLSTLCSPSAVAAQPLQYNVDVGEDD